jgi:hypothetical protein
VVARSVRVKARTEAIWGLTSRRVRMWEPGRLVGEVDSLGLGVYCLLTVKPVQRIIATDADLLGFVDGGTPQDLL